MLLSQHTMGTKAFWCFFCQCAYEVVLEPQYKKALFVTTLMLNIVFTKASAALLLF